MMKIFLILIGLVICGCASQPTELTQEERDLHVFYEEPKIEYEKLGRIDATSRANHAMDVLEKILSRAVELGADGVIIHSIRNKGTVAGGGDAFGTGGGGGFAVYQIQATAIRYVN
jgi:hypothetical protein